MSGHSALHKPWASLRREREAASLGTWVFLGSETMFFAGALLAYAFYRTLWPAEFLIVIVAPAAPGATVYWKVAWPLVSCAVWPLASTVLPI